MISTDYQGDDVMITLTPNRSASWSHTKYLMAIMVFFVMVIALAWGIVGAWVILPFAGIEVGLLAYIMYRVSQATYRSETVKVTANEVTYVRGKLSGKSQRSYITLSRDELHIDVIETENNWCLPDIRLITPEHTISVGSFLNLPDRQQLTDLLRDCGIPHCRTHWWKER
ncbi:DUF2244 domain-containing protein [Alteromonas oceanisediminis]|uniref:DUF2244 domain-containing protein n=1 Tax=Alteromonas oceanisediminis TaxID=2836180 RepID=UPI001BDA2E5A|nr:DUF2244 domain-containing protein [Alteromonas oceanisediminis]MBT0587469.1 DUF2244 domain-containing protein [Alteromonas oceanisediminis]